MALEMKQHCERCNTKLTVHSHAHICSFECTFCENCSKLMQSICPNCDGELVRRPRRKESEPVTK